MKSVSSLVSQLLSTPRIADEHVFKKTAF